MRGLMAAVIGMGVLIVGGVTVLGVTIVHRLGAGTVASAPLVLDEPPGTRIVGVAGVADRLAVQLSGGGPDRVVLLDGHGERVLGRVLLGR